jgi:hypothetical protein
MKDLRCGLIPKRPQLAFNVTGSFFQRRVVNEIVRPSGDRLDVLTQASGECGFVVAQRRKWASM